MTLHSYSDPEPDAIERREAIIRGFTAHALNTAGELVLKDRSAQYGPVEENFALVADYWTTYIHDLLRFYGVDYSTFALTAHDVGIMMVLFKLARASGPFKDDTYHDMIGYAALSYGIAKAGLEDVEDDKASLSENPTGGENPSGDPENGQPTGPECGVLPCGNTEPPTRVH